MAYLPVVSRTTPLVSGIPPIIPSHEVFLGGHLDFHRKYFDKQKYFRIEVLPPNLINLEVIFVVVGDNHLIMGFLMSSRKWKLCFLNRHGVTVELKTDTSQRSCIGYER